jgi:hypothetical protein
MSPTRGDTFVIQEPGTESSPVTFHSFLLGLAATALIHLGAQPNPELGKIQVDLVLARQSLDLLAMLREKTRGNLTQDEERLFDSLLSDLRFKFVEASRR